MSHRRMVNRGRLNIDSPAATTRQRGSQAPEREATELPPYEPPSCALSENAKRKLESLSVDHDYSKYKKHLKSTIEAITTSAADLNERLAIQTDELKRVTERRQQKEEGGSSQEPTDREAKAKAYLQGLNKQASRLTDEAEQALRVLIDYSDELAMKDTILKNVSENVAAAAPVARRRRPRGEDGEVAGENDAPAADAEILSAIESLQQAQEDYIKEYISKSLKMRYGTHNDYKNFKRAIHDAQHQGPNAPPVPHANTWFPEEHGESAGSRRRANNTTDNANNGEDSEEEIVITGTTTILKCPLTLQYFENPMSNHVCNHSFERGAFMPYFESEAVAYRAAPSRGARQRIPQDERKVQCPAAGCDKMITMADCYDDALLARQVKRAKRAELRQANENEDDEDDGPRGTQNRPTQLDDDDSDGVEIDDDDNVEDRKKEFARIKRERAQSRGLSVAPSHAQEDESEPEDGVEAMDVVY